MFRIEIEFDFGLLILIQVLLENECIPKRDHLIYIFRISDY